MSGHTPGPWSLPHFAKPEVGCQCGYVLTEEHFGAIATVHCSGEGDIFANGDNPKFPQAVANARLIAAAPELLKALIQCAAQLEITAGMVHDERQALIAARAAIAKAQP